ncbi:MAG TPA: MATE family efflux transporter [Candidatus Kapabacteria bacterium]|nr:MATE family efflux transporter [Candidatus Kapabacteria bacterium]
MTQYWPSGDRLRQILTLALPIIAGMVSQSLLNLADAWIVGQLGSNALAAVGMGGNTNYLASAAVIGIGAGVQAMVARRKGEDNAGAMATPLNAGLLVGILASIPLFVLFYSGSGWLMSVLIDDPAVTPLADEYFSVRVIGMFALAMNFSFRGYWNGINRSMVYMRTLVIMHVADLAISYALVFGLWGLPKMGVYGAGLGTTLALYLASALYLLQCWQHSRPHGFLRKMPSRALLVNTLKLSLPNSIQQVFFAGGLTVLFWILAQIGTPELAVGHVLITLILFLILPAMGLGLSATSLVSQALGRKDAEDAVRWGVNITLLGMAMLWSIALPLLLFPDFILSQFLTEPALIELGRMSLRITALFIGIDAAGIILTQCLLGAGASGLVMRTSILFQWGFFLPVAWLIGPVLGFGLTAVWLLQMVQRLLLALTMAYHWRGRRWAAIRI